MGEALTRIGALHQASPDVVRAAIARALRAGPASTDDAPLGRIALHPAQRDGAGRVERTLRRWGGALLCDEPGSGKTFTALAVAAQRGGSTAVVAPAALRRMWRDAASAAGVAVRIVTVESIGRGHPVPASDLLIVDEAHHLRNPRTRRHRAVAAACRTMPVLLVTATPVHNRRDDLVALLRLFLGDRAGALTDAELPTIVVRRPLAASASDRMPEIGPTQWLRVPAPTWPLEALRRLPPPVPAADGSEAQALVVHTLLRQWASSDAALRGALRRRIARGVALLAALDAGRHPTRRELRAWSCADGAVQLAFPELVVRAAAPPLAVAATRAALGSHVAALRALADQVTARCTSDRWRVERLRSLRREYAGARIVAFTSYADTARMLYRALRHAGGVALLTAHGGEVAGGRVSRAELLAHFDPRAHAAHPVDACDAVTLLVTTELASEGVDLHAARVVVHLDLPWTVARLTQRVGRVARLGSPHREIRVVGFRPGPTVERTLHATATLRRKGCITARTIGGGSLHAAPDVRRSSDVACAERVRAMVARWALDGHPAPQEPVWGIARAQRVSALACYVAGGDVRLVGWEGRDSATDSVRVVERVVHRAAGATAARCRRAADPAGGSLLEHARDALRRWEERECARNDAGVSERRVRAHPAPVRPAGTAPLWARPGHVAAGAAPLDAPVDAPPPAPRLLALLLLSPDAAPGARADGRSLTARPSAPRSTRSPPPAAVRRRAPAGGTSP